MKRIAPCFLLIAAVVAPPGSAFAQRSGGTPSVSTSDSVVDGLRFHRTSATSGFIQVTDVATGQLAGTIVLTPKSPTPVFASMPGYEDKVRAAYKKYSGSSPDSGAQTGGGADIASRSSAGLTVDGVVGMLKAASRKTSSSKKSTVAARHLT